jgi:hypothetical protein
MEPTIKWNADLFGVEIQTEDEHFVISAQPSMVMTWDDAVRYLKGDEKWQLPTKRQLQIVSANIFAINDLINENGGYEIRGLFWAADGSNEFCAWYVSTISGNASPYGKIYSYYVRSVSSLKN